MTEIKGVFEKWNRPQSDVAQEASDYVNEFIKTNFDGATFKD